MSALEIDSKELNRRIAAADSDIVAKQEALDGKVAELKDAGKDLASLSPEEAGQITEATREIDGLKADRLKLSDFAQTMAERHAARRTPAEAAMGSGSLHAMLLGAKGKAEILSGGIASPAVEVSSREQLVAAMRGGRPWFGAAATAVIDAGIPLDERLFPPVDIRRRQVRLLDLINVGATDTDTVVYARQTTRTSAAAETALGTAYSEASFDFEQVTAPVRSIGHFTTAYRENIADAAQFDTLVRTQLQEDVLLRLESQILAGAGTGVNLEGILASSLSGEINAVARDTTNERRVAALHRGITAVRVNAFREPNAILLHPNDYQDMVLEEVNLTGTTGSAIAFVPSLQVGTPGSVWGLPIVVSPVATEGTGIVGYWNDATLWMREGVSLRVSDSHSDYFTKRQVAILADMRGAFSVQRPASFTAVTLL